MHSLVIVYCVDIARKFRTGIFSESNSQHFVLQGRTIKNLDILLGGKQGLQKGGNVWFLLRVICIDLRGCIYCLVTHVIILYRDNKLEDEAVLILALTKEKIVKKRREKFIVYDTICIYVHMYLEHCPSIHALLIF